MIDSADPLFGCRVNRIPKPKVEDCDSVDRIEDVSAFVEEQFAVRVHLRLRAETSHVCIHDVTEKDMQSDAKAPPHNNLVVSMYTVVKSAYRNQEACE